MEKQFPAIFGIITLVLLCTGAFSPWWFAFDTSKVGAKMSGERHYTSDRIEVHMGLFYCVIVGEDFRKVVGYGECIGSNTIPIGLLEYQAEVIIGVVLCLISVILTFTYKKDGTNGVLVAIFIMYIIGAMAAILVGLTGDRMMIVAKFGLIWFSSFREDFCNNWNKEQRTAECIHGMITLMAVGRWLTKVLLEARENDVTLTVPYSISFSGLGAVFCVVTMIIISRMLCKYNAVGQPQDDQESSEISEESYQQIHPKTKVTASMGQTQDIDLTTVLAYLTNLKNRDEMYAYAN